MGRFCLYGTVICLLLDEKRKTRRSRLTGLLTPREKSGEIRKKQNCDRHLKVTTNPNAMVEQFCKSILQIETRNSKGLANLVMGLSSQISASSVVEIALSPAYHYQYSSISKSIDELNKAQGCSAGIESCLLDRQEVEKKFAN